MPWSGRRRTNERGAGMVLVHPEVVKEWVESHGGKPGHLANTYVGDEVGILRVWFPGHTFARFVPLTWEQFLDKMVNKSLALYCEEDARSGRPYTRVVPAPQLR